MPKVKWGGADLASAIDDHDFDRDDQYRPYEGPRPAPGMYEWEITRIKKDVSSGGFPQLKVSLTLKGRKAHTRQFDGFRMMDFIVVKEDGSNAFAVAPLLRALGVSGSDFVNRTIVDSDGYVTQIGRVKIGGNAVLGSIRPQQRNTEYFDISYWPPKDQAPEDDDADDADDADDDQTDEDDADDTPEEPPARPAARKATKATRKPAPF